MDTLSEYDFFLPEGLIATKAITDRLASRLMVVGNDDLTLKHDIFSNIGHYLRPGDVLVVNNTKVRKARIYAYKETGGRVEILLAKPLYQGNWEALIFAKGPILPQAKFALKNGDSFATVHVMRKMAEGTNLYEISCDVDLGNYAELSGELPLPPYFNRRPEPLDEVRYQTIFAKNLGAVAAPTAGLHFTEELINALKAANVNIIELTLHVGPGTFMPIRSQNIADHKMHSEFFSLDHDAALTLNRAKKLKQRIIAVGTTTMRSLEQVMQWAHERGENAFYETSGETSLFIRPGYRFLACDALVTNFHTPRSTLLVLVAAIVGRERLLKAYQEAIEREYRFYSYGDACFLEIRKS